MPPLAHRDAAASGLRYVSPDDPGITRRRAGRGFTYRTSGGRPIRSARELARIRGIVIPPAWTEVWICPDPRGHIQAVGRDARGRRQYRYHPRFRARRDDGKFGRLIRFGESLPRIRRRIRKDLGARGLPRDKVLAAVLGLLDTTFLRVGNASYARLNRSFGVSTLRDRHATVSGSTLHLRFRGKGGRTEERSLVDRRLAAVVRRCQDLPGQLLFQYLDEDGEARAISSEDVNAYLRDAAGRDDLSAKDFRTWTATVLAYRALRDGSEGADGRDHGKGKSEGEGRRRRRDPIVDAVRRTAEILGDTAAVTRSSYVHPGVLEAFEDGSTTPGTGRRRTGDEPPDRGEELEVLALLRAGDARRPQVDRRGVAGRSRGRAA
jgi:DNA topoisomerase-1